MLFNLSMVCFHSLSFENMLSMAKYGSEYKCNSITIKHCSNVSKHMILSNNTHTNMKPHPKTYFEWPGLESWLTACQQSNSLTWANISNFCSPGNQDIKSFNDPISSGGLNAEQENVVIAFGW